MECPTFLRSKGKDMAITLSDDEVSDLESKSNQEGNFMAFTTTVIVSEIETADENPSMGNSLRMPTCKRLITSYARLQPKMLWVLS